MLTTSQLLKEIDKKKQEVIGFSENLRAVGEAESLPGVSAIRERLEIGEGLRFELKELLHWYQTILLTEAVDQDPAMAIDSRITQRFINQVNHTLDEYENARFSLISKIT